MTMEEQSMKKLIGKKLLAGIVCASMILGIPVAGYSQDEEALLTAAVSEEAPSTEEVLAGADDIAAPAAEVQIPEAPAQEEVAEPAGEDTEVPDAADEVTEEDAVVDEAVEDVFEEEIFVAAEEEEVAEEPADGILLEAAEEDGESEAELKAAASITEVSTFTEFKDAILQAKEEDTIRLTADISYTSGSFHINKDTLKDANSITIDLNKKKLTLDDSYWFYVEDGKNVTIPNGTLEGSLNVVGSTVNIPTGTKVVEAYCLKISEGGTVNVDGGTLSSTVGSNLRSIEVYKGTLNLNKGSLFEMSVDGRTGIHLMDSGAVVNVTEANINVTGDGDGVLVEGGTFEIKKGTTCSTITTKGNAITLGDNNGLASKIIINGTQDTTKIISTNGKAVYEDSSDGYGSIEINGGYLKGATEDIYSKNKEKIVKVTTEDVGFGHVVNRKYLPSVNCRADKKNADGAYIIRTLTASNSAAAYIRDGDTFYTDTVQEAMTVITGETYSPKTGDTVKLFKDIIPETTDEKTITVGINRTIDLNKHLLKTKLTVKGCTVTIKNGTMMPYTNDTTLVVDVGANVTLDSSLTVNASDNGDEAILVGGDSAGTYNLTVKCPVTGKYYAAFIEQGKCTVTFDSAKLTATESYLGSVVRTGSNSKDAKVTINKTTITGPQGVQILAGECTITDSVITGKGDQNGDPSPGTTGNGSAIMFGDKAKVTIKSGTFTSEKGHALYIEAATSGNTISGGTFRSKRADWDAVSGKKSTNMITGGNFSPNKTNVIKDSVDTSKSALVGVTDGVFYAAAYDKVMSTLYAANASATKFTVGAAVAGKTITGCKVHTAFLNKSGANVSLLIGTDASVAKNKGTLPSSATTTAWIFHNDLVKLTKTANKTATCTLPAVSADCWYCETLKKTYSDAGGQTEITGVITANAKGHSWGSWNANGDRTCSACGKKEHDASKVQKYGIAGRPQNLKLASTKARKLKVSWKKPKKTTLKKITGVQIQIATDKNFTKIVKTKKVKKTKTSITFTLKKKKKYYVRVRFYKGSKVSRWSAVKNKKTK